MNRKEIAKQYKIKMVNVESMLEDMVRQFRNDKHSLDIQQLRLITEYLIEDREFDTDYIDEIEQELEQEKEKNKELEKQINLNKKTVEIAQTQILEYSQGYKDGLNKETTATAIVARELELNFIRQEIKHKYISKDKLKFILSKLNISDIEPWSTYKIDGQILFDLQELL